MKTIKRSLICACVFGLTFAVSTPPADAGGLGLFRRVLPNRAVSTPRAIWVPRTNRTWSTQGMRTVTQKGVSNRNASSNEWPGAIGSPSYRYQIFQDVNGYWK